MAEKAGLSGGFPLGPAAKASRVKAELKAKKFTLAALASQHAGLQDLVSALAALALQLQEVASKQNQLIAAVQAPQQVQVKAADTAHTLPAARPALRNPVCQVVPPAQAVPKRLADVLGLSPPVRPQASWLS